MGNVGTSKRGRLVEWVEKASFDRLNKLFEINTIERHYQTLLSARNLLAVVQEPQPYVVNILPRRLPKFVVPGEHFVLKNLPFYKRARKAVAKARQEHLDQQEEKRQEGTLRKAPGEKGRDSSPMVRSPTAKEKKKKTIVQALQVVSPVPDLSSSSSESAPSRPDKPVPEPEEPRLRLAVIVSGRPLLVVNHQNGHTLSHLVCPIQIPSQFHICITLPSYLIPDSG